MMALMWAAIVGLVVGALAKLIMPGKDPGGVIVTSLLGIAGSVVGNWLGSALGLYTSGAPAGFILSLVGALFLLWVYRLLAAKRAVTT
jgi:uncharacterized membrane protein YeaQ/YmgE (transglycosylase-associated protein family)